MSRNERVVTLLAILVLVASFAFAGGKSDEPTTTTEPGVRELHIYFVNAFTGQSAPYGLDSVEGGELAAKQINEAGGFTDNCGNKYTIKITEYDMADSPEQAIAGVRKAADDPSVLVVHGPTPSTGFLPVVPVAGQLKMPVLGVGAAGPVKEWNPWVNRVSIPVSVGEPAFIKHMASRFDIKRVAVIYDITQDTLRNSAEILKNLADEVGYEVVAYEASREGDVDFRPQLTTIKAAKPGWIAIYETQDDYAAVVNQMAQLGIDAKVLGGSGTAQPNTTEAWELTEGKVKGHYFYYAAYFRLEDPNRPEIAEWVKAYEAEYGSMPSAFSFYGRDGLELTVDIVKKICTATDRNKFRDAIGLVEDFPGFTGPISFQNPPTGERKNPRVKVCVQTGKGTYDVVE